MSSPSEEAASQGIGASHQPNQSLDMGFLRSITLGSEAMQTIVELLSDPDAKRLFSGTTPSLISHILAKPYMRDLATIDRTRFAEICLIAAGSSRIIVEAKLAGYPALREAINTGETQMNTVLGNQRDWITKNSDGQLNLTALSLVGHMIARAAPISASNPAVKQLRAKIGGKDIWTMKNALEMRQGYSKPCQIWVERIKKNPVADVDKHLQAVIDYFAPAGVMASGPSH